jgi:hypothetical protein
MHGYVLLAFFAILELSFAHTWVERLLNIFPINDNAPQAPGFPRGFGKLGSILFA